MMGYYDLTTFLLKYVVSNNPWVNENMIADAKALTDQDLMITFKDGTTIIFDTFSNTTRQLNETSDDNSDDELRRQFRDRLRTIMKRKGIDEETLSTMIDTTQPMISRYLTGRSVPNIITLKKISKALGCSLDDFFYSNFQ